MAPGELYLDGKMFGATLDAFNAIRMSPFNEHEGATRMVVNVDARQGPRWARGATEQVDAERVNVFDAVVKHIADRRAAGGKVLVTAWTEGSLERLLQVLAEHGLQRVKTIEAMKDVDALAKGEAAAAVLNLESGFETGNLVVIGEQDILGDRMVRRSKRSKRGANFISEVAGLDEGSIVVHAEHGIGRFVGLRTIEAAGAPHACLELLYADDAKLFLPVENIDLLSRYGSETSDAQLDRLGGGAWQMRKAKLKKRLLDMAGSLIRIAAERLTRHAPALIAPDGIYDEFAARFPYDETEDQANAIDAVRDDLAAGRPMDRLVCGDVGFGKTEVALRAAFVAAMNGAQVAIVVPTTLLARQHFKTFSERFRGLPIRVQQASRLVGAKELALTKKEVAEGKTDIVVGTHALLGNGIKFANLGLLVIDEEQHFGVKHKERLKELKSDVHVLTLSATPIPRTLQLAMTGVRELSLIKTPPVDRMAVRTFISPFDSLVIRETLMREHYRGPEFLCLPTARRPFRYPRFPAIGSAGTESRRCPRPDAGERARRHHECLLRGPLRCAAVDHHRRIWPRRADCQHPDRPPRRHVRACPALPAARSCRTFQGAGFRAVHAARQQGAHLDGRAPPEGAAVAGYPRRRLPARQPRSDIRGAGNLLGEEQSGHIKEVGFELYQQMLEEAVVEVKGVDEIQDTGWSPQISVGTPVMIPDDYVPDLHLRMALYRRLGEITDLKEIDGFGAEMIDRFGPMPIEVQHLLKIVYIKSLCRIAHVEKLDAGPKGVVVQFRHKEFPNPAALVGYIARQGSMAKIRPDHSVFLTRDLPTPAKRLAGAAVVMTQLAELAK